MQQFIFSLLAWLADYLNL